MSQRAGNELYNYLKSISDMGYPMDIVVERSVETEEKQTLSKKERLAKLFYEVRNCSHCSYANSAHQMIFGTGNAESDLLIIGDSPCLDDLQRKRPFSGRVNQLFYNMISAINLNPEKDLFTTTLMKCLPHSARTPSESEVESCLPILLRQIAIIKPRAILIFGELTAKHLINTPALGEEDGRYEGIAVVKTSAIPDIFEKPALKRDVWSDLQRFQRVINAV